MFPLERSRRLRGSENIRKMVRENRLSVEDLVYPMFVCEGENVKNPITSMPDIYQMSIDNVVEECVRAENFGICAVILFGIPSYKDLEASSAYDDNGIVQRAIRAIKKAVNNLLVITDVCLCEYTSHGHCGIIDNNDVNNDDTLFYLCKQAVSHVKAGADIVAPSDMMDGRVIAIREALDDEGFQNIPIMSYSVKYASAFYGPFRNAAESAPQFGNRKTYQMDGANRREALKEAKQDIEEGADMIMVKPALIYLDIIRDIRNITDLPLVAYNVSGEYSMLVNAVQSGLMDESAIMESLVSIKRAGADIIITYFALKIAEKLKD